MSFLSQRSDVHIVRTESVAHEIETRESGGKRGDLSAKLARIEIDFELTLDSNVYMIYIMMYIYMF